MSLIRQICVSNCYIFLLLIEQAVLTKNTIQVVRITHPVAVVVDYQSSVLFGFLYREQKKRLKSTNYFNLQKAVVDELLATL